MTSAAMPRTAAAARGAAVRERWRMEAEARGLVLVMTLVLVFGLAVLYSASAIIAEQENHNSWFYVARQAMGVLAGVVAFAVAAKVNAERFYALAWPIMWATIVALTLVLVLPESFAPRVHGSRRFLFQSSIQPTEFGKLAVVIWTSMLIVKKGDQLKRLTKGVLPFFVVIGVLNILAYLQPDLSVVMLYTLILAVLLFAGGVRIAHFVIIVGLAIPVLWTRIETKQYALLRLTSFFDPGAPAEMKYQLKQSLIAVGSGGAFGVGFGEGRQQYGFLPFPHSDFIASNIGEEWGFIGLAAVTIAFAAYGLFGLRIARKARTPFLQLVAIGLTFVTVLTAYLHIGVVIGLLPTTGLTLPFVSYGRSNIVLTMLMTGILVNIGSVKERVIGSGATDPLAQPSR